MDRANAVLARVTSWDELQRAIEALPTEKQKGDCFESFVRYYLTLEPRYATKLRRVWSLSQVPSELRTKLSLPKTDEGIDLVAETNDGRYWAIQAKYRGAADSSLSRTELSTFTDLTFTICQNFDLALVCTTAERFSHKLGLYGNRLAFCAGDTWPHLTRDFFAGLAAHLEGGASRPTPYLPRPHQVRAIDSARRHFVKQSKARGKLIMPCGTGKSLTAFWIAQLLNANTVLVAVPSLALIRQTLAVWAREHFANGEEVHWIAVCSDPTVGDPEEDDPAVYTQDLGIDVETDAARIAHWLKRTGDGRKKVVFSTYQSGRTIAEAARIADVEFDFAVLDEAHRTVGSKQTLFSHLLFDEHVRIRHRLFMTATERRFSGRSNNIVGMESAELYGDTFELLSFKAALDEKPPILSDYTVITVVVTAAEVDALIEQNLFVRPDRGHWNREIEAQMLSAVVALRKAMMEHPIKHAVSFHSSIARASVFRENQAVFSDAFPEYGKLEVFHVSGRTKTAIRDRIMMDFERSERALVTNARCLSEGVDVPDIDCVLFADPRRSTVDIVQAVGRALRPSKAKGTGSAFVIVPVQISDISDEVEVEEAVFGSVISVLRALAANDERIVEYFRSVAAGNAWSGGRVPFEVVMPDARSIDAQNFVHSIELKCWSRLGSLAWRPFAEARAFVHSLELRTIDEWRYYSMGGTELGKRPSDIPSAPDLVYEGKGWAGFPDWLGLPESGKRELRSFDEAREFARALELKGQRQWFDYVTGRLNHPVPLPPDIPRNPATVYLNAGWKGYGDFLGTGRLKRPSWREFEHARQFARTLGLSDRAEWQQYMRGERAGLPKRPADIPANPAATYHKSGWSGWGDWLGTARTSTKTREMLPYAEARAFVRELKLASVHDWYAYVRGDRSDLGNRPPSIPAKPSAYYRNHGWNGWSDWLGVEIAVRKSGRRRQTWRPFTEARNFARSLGLKDIQAWMAYCRGQIPSLPPRPRDVPVYPKRIYVEWRDWYDWLGKARTEWVPFDEARTFVRSLRLGSRREYDAYRRGAFPQLPECPFELPGNPIGVYGREWVSWPDWLGEHRAWRDFQDARLFARSLRLRSSTEWKAYCQGRIPKLAARPKDVPSNPAAAYATSGWRGWRDFLIGDQPAQDCANSLSPQLGIER